MAIRAFTGFDHYRLTGVRVTDQELGHGSYATVLELEYVGLKCAGKKIHELLLRQGDTSYSVRRFDEECRILSEVRHPNIVQYLGVYFQPRAQVPILVMEFLPINLTSCIERYSILPEEISYSILHDVALGLCYLHSQTPPIIHRDLSSNNILLTPNMTAKVSDLGVARILNLTPLQMSRLTQTPGTPAYMPPEVMVANPRYDTSVDEFSYGILMIHMFSQQWPEPQIGQVRTEPDGKMIPVSEAERREVFLQAIGNDHPLMELILKCITNHPESRAHASEIWKELAKMVLHFPAFFTNRLEMMRQIEADKEEKRSLTKEGERKDRIIQQKEDEIISCREMLQAEKKQRIAEINRLEVAYSSEMEHLRLQVRDLNTQSQLMQAENEAEVIELKSKAEVLENQVENNDSTLFQFETQLAKERQQFEAELVNEREVNRKLMADLLKLQSKIIILQGTISNLQSDIKGKDASIIRRDSEIEAKARVLEEKDATISAIGEQLNKARECLIANQQASIIPS